MALDAPMTDDRATVLWEVGQVGHQIPPRYWYRLLLEQWELNGKYHLRFHYWQLGQGDVFFDVGQASHDDLRNMIGG